MNVLTQLENMIEGNIRYPNIGICGNIENVRFNGMRSYFRTWKHFSGNIYYPVPDPTGILDPYSMYQLANNKWEGEYGELRKDLARHIIKEIEDILYD